jgi:hypothetical protein
LVLTCWCCCFLFVVILVAQGKRQKGEVYSLIPSLIRRIDRACESYSPPTIHFFVVSPSPIIVPLHSTPPRRVHSVSALAYGLSFFLIFFFFLIFLTPLIISWNMDLVHLFCSTFSLRYLLNQFKYATTDLTKTMR